MADRPDPMPLEVERLLRAFLAEQDRLREIAAARRRAIAAADPRAMARCVQDENEVVQRLAALDRERNALATAAAKRFPAPAGAGRDWRPTLSWIAQRIEEPVRSSLLALAAELRERIETVRRENESVRMAADTLARHMQGILRAVEQRLNHSGAYGRRGLVPAGPAIVSCMDLTT